MLSKYQLIIADPYNISIGTIIMPSFFNKEAEKNWRQRWKSIVQVNEQYCML